MALGRKRRQQAITAGAEERRAVARGLPTEVTGIPYGTGDEMPVTVDEALACSAIAGALNVICGRGCTLPLQRWRAETELPTGPFLTHPEADSNVPLTVTIWNTLADMCLGGVGYWRVLVRDFSAFPLVVRRIPPGRCAPRLEYVPGIGNVIQAWQVDGIELAEREVIAFSAPNPRGWCVDGARAIRTAMALERAAKHYAEEPMPTLIFKNTSGVDLPDEKVTAILQRWKESRGERTTGYVNAALDVDHIGFSAVDMQLTEGRQQAVLEIARVTGVPHGLLAASPQGATLTYRNIEGEAQQALQAMQPYLVVMEQRLSSDDVVPHGQSVRFDLTELMRPATGDLVTMIQTLYPMGLLAADEARSLLGMGNAPSDLTPPAGPEPASPASLAGAGLATAIGAGVVEFGGVGLVSRLAGLQIAERARLLEPAPGAIWAAAPVGGVDEAKRTITGLVVPWDTSARVNGADFPVRFGRGSILVDEGARLLAHHDRTQPLGAPTDWKDTPGGLRATFKVARTRAGDEALSMAADGILDGLSIGAELVEVDEHRGEILVTASLAREVSLVTLPAWASARVGA